MVVANKRQKDKKTKKTKNKKDKKDKKTRKTKKTKKKREEGAKIKDMINTLTFVKESSESVKFLIHPFHKGVDVIQPHQTGFVDLANTESLYKKGKEKVTEIEAEKDDIEIEEEFPVLFNSSSSSSSSSSSTIDEKPSKKVRFL